MRCRPRPTLARGRDRAGPSGRQRPEEDLPGQDGLGEQAHEHVRLLARQVVTPATDLAVLQDHGDGEDVEGDEERDEDGPHETRDGGGARLRGGRPEGDGDDDPGHDAGHDAEDVVVPLRLGAALIGRLHGPAEEVHGSVHPEDGHQRADLLDAGERGDDDDHHARAERVLEPPQGLDAGRQTAFIPAAQRPRHEEVRDRAHEQEERHRRPDGQIEERPLRLHEGLAGGIEGQVARHDRRADDGIRCQRDGQDDDGLDAMESGEHGIPTEQAVGPLRAERSGHHVGDGGAGDGGGHGFLPGPRGNGPCLHSLQSLASCTPSVKGLYSMAADPGRTSTQPLVSSSA